MKKLAALALFFVLLVNSISYAQKDNNSEITAHEIQSIINYLASDKLEGRFTGSPGAEKAAAFIAKEFKNYGLKPLFKEGYFQNFPFVSSLELTGNNYLSFNIKGKTFKPGLMEDFITAPFSGKANAEGDIVFAGYGISAPSLNYDDYEGIDVKGKTVLVMRYTPEANNPHSEFEKFAAYRYKAKVALEKGAAAVIFVNPYFPKDEEDRLMKLTYDMAGGIDSLAAFQIKREIADKLFKADGLDFKTYQAEIDKDKKPASFTFKNSNIKLAAEVKQVIKDGKNVAGVLEGNDPVLKNQYMVIGAHYDHLGYGEIGSLYRGKGPMIHNGADDNASGTAGILELAEKFASMKNQLKRSIIFVSFAGEELGTLGSGYFVDHPPVPLDKMSAMINLDMVGRLNDEHKLIVYGAGTSSGFKALLQKDNGTFNFKLALNDEGYAPSDQSSFYAKKIPVLFFFTGTHSDYHRPTDDADKINSSGEESVVKYVYMIASQIDTLSETPTYIDVPRKDAGRAMVFRVYVGTVPDYAGGTDGLKINGVNEGSPAQKGGLKGGDIIIGFGGKKISNIYDYTYALGDFSPGDIVDVVVLREGKKVNLKVELGAR